MTRVNVYNEDGEMAFWFDVDRAQQWNEGTRWNGRNHISLATGSQWNHQRLYRTRKGRWVVYHWSQWQGSCDSYEEVTSAQAAQWFARNEYDDVPEELQAVICKMEG